MKIKKIPKIDGPISWYETSPYKGQLNSKTLTGNANFDYVIIGGGFTGLGAARRLAEMKPESTIAVFDAMKIGQGASGRNSGFLMDVPTAIYTDGFEKDFATQLLKITRFGVKKLKDIVDEFDLSVEWSQKGSLVGAYSEKTYGKLQDLTDALDALNEPYEVWDKEKLAQELGTTYYDKAVFKPGGVLLNPASLIMGLAKSLPENVSVYEDTPLVSMDLTKKNTLTFLHGSVCANKVLFATNAFNETLGMARSRLAPIFTYSSMTRVLTEAELSGFTKEEYGLTPAHAAGTTLRFTYDKRILIRNSLAACLESNDAKLKKAINQHKTSFNNRFPHLTHVPFEYSWGGNLCVTMNGQAQFQQNKSNIYSVAGMNGTGVVKGTFLGHYMAEFMCGIDSPELAFLKEYSQPTWVPPEPFRGIGVTVRLALEQLLAGKEV